MRAHRRVGEHLVVHVFVALGEFAESIDYGVTASASRQRLFVCSPTAAALLFTACLWRRPRVPPVMGRIVLALVLAACGKAAKALTHEHAPPAAADGAG